VKPLILLLICATGALSLPMNAETIKVPVGQQSNQYSEIFRPKRGMQKQQVLQLFGPPIIKSEARGKPPISNWKYVEFVVYFEYDHVIHSVLVHRKLDQN
jgi:hypothetical protein